MGLTRENKYRYTKDLLELEGGMTHSTDKRCEGFLPLAAWEPFLASHPDQRFADFLRRGIIHGFCIGFGHATDLQLTLDNLRSVQLSKTRQ